VLFCIFFAAFPVFPHAEGKVKKTFFLKKIIHTYNSYLINMPIFAYFFAGEKMSKSCVQSF